MSSLYETSPIRVNTPPRAVPKSTSPCRFHAQSGELRVGLPARCSSGSAGLNPVGSPGKVGGPGVAIWLGASGALVRKSAGGESMYDMAPRSRYADVSWDES